MTTLPAISDTRRRVDRAARILLAAATALALVPLVLILFKLVVKGVGAWGLDFFSTDPNGNFLGDPGGVRSAVLGTFAIVGLAAAIAVPIGIGVALYLTEYGRGRRFASAVRYLIDVMTGVPSIVFGLFVYITLVLTGVGGGFAGWKGSVALALLMLPIVARSAEVALGLVPTSVREAALALGAPRWRTIARVVLPTALPALVTGSLLALARAAGETAPLLFTATIVQDTSFDVLRRMNSLPAQIFADVGQAQDRLVARAWGAALALVALILLLTFAARFFSRRSRV